VGQAAGILQPHWCLMLMQQMLLGMPAWSPGCCHDQGSAYDTS